MTNRVTSAFSKASCASTKLRAWRRDNLRQCHAKRSGHRGRASFRALGFVRAVGCGIIRLVTRWTNLTLDTTDENPVARPPVVARRSAGTPLIRVQSLCGPRPRGPERFLRCGRVRAGARAGVAHLAARAGRQYAGRGGTRDAAGPRRLPLSLPGGDYGSFPGARLGR